MKQMTPTAVERAMKLQDVMLRAMAKRITWYQAAEILGISCRQMQRWHTRFEHEGYEGLFDRRRGVPSPKRVPLATVEEVLRLYQEQYFDFNVRHFHEKLVEEHAIKLSYTWVKQALQGRGTCPQRWQVHSWTTQTGATRDRDLRCGEYSRSTNERHVRSDVAGQRHAGTVSVGHTRHDEWSNSFDRPRRNGEQKSKGKFEL
jgi:transposase